MKKGVFSKLTVVFCVLEMAFIQMWAMKMAGETGLMVTELLTVNHAVFGGELLLLCLKKLLSHDTENKE
jgi:hypothetical protein